MPHNRLQVIRGPLFSSKKASHLATHPVHHVYLFVIMIEGERNLPERKEKMLNPREVQDAIDDVLGNKKDPLRMTRDFLKRVEDYTDRVHRLEKKLEAQICEKDRCGGNWVSVIKTLEKIEETEQLVQRAKELLSTTVTKVSDAIGRLGNNDQWNILMLRYVDCVSDWDEIAEKIGKPKATVRRIHTAALNEMQNVLAEIETKRTAK